MWLMCAQLLQQNFNRVKRCIMVLINIGSYINSCFEWESAQRSILSFLVSTHAPNTHTHTVTHTHTHGRTQTLGRTHNVLISDCVCVYFGIICDYYIRSIYKWECRVVCLRLCTEICACSKVSQMSIQTMRLNQSCKCVQT